MSRLDKLKQIVALDPNDPLSHYALGLEYINLAQWDDAIAAFNRALRLDDRYTAAYFHRGRAEISAGQLEAARQTLQRGIELAQATGDWKTVEEMRLLLKSAS